MKLTFREIEPFVKKPNPAARVVLIYGPDDGLMRERSKMISQSIVKDLNDPFNVAFQPILFSPTRRAYLTKPTPFQ